ncbi:MAG: AraC family transcriptional regulator [Treponema sp.]|nr:AraC family transcriptional regulator [Treponema sp.]
MYIHEKVSLDENVTLIAENGKCAVYKVKDASGEGLMTCYGVFPGVILMYNDFHMEHCHSHIKPRTDLFCIDHCREGRIEWELDNGACIYREAGTLQFDTREKHALNFNCPLRHYHGLTINIFIDEAQEHLSASPDGFAVDLRGLRGKLCPGGWPSAMAADKIPDFHFELLYTIHEPIRAPLSRIKILELLLYVDVLPAGNEFIKRPYFRKDQVDTIKAIERFMTARPENHYTIAELSSRFKISITSMQRCFKGVYGSSIYAYMKAWRMNAAAVMLRQKNASVITIAADFGYDNASKFAGAFKDVLGKSPREYRKDMV